LSQALTLFTTPVTYLYMDNFSTFMGRHLRRARAAPQTSAATPADRKAA
jgi:hypothetical protein